VKARSDVARRVGHLEDRFGELGRCGCVEFKSAADFPADQLDPESGKQWYRFLWEPCPDHSGCERRALYTYMVGPGLEDNRKPAAREHLPGCQCPEHRASPEPPGPRSAPPSAPARVQATPESEHEAEPANEPKRPRERTGKAWESQRSRRRGSITRGIEHREF
jgi:hypothetical protein